MQVIERPARLCPYVEITVEGIPVPQSRPRFTRAKGRPWSNNRRVLAWKDRVASAYEVAEGKKYTCPVWLRCEFYFERPQSNKDLPQKDARHPLRPYTPDIDNLVKAVMDALNGYAYDDDRQIVVVEAVKYYAGPNESAKAVISVAETKICYDKKKDASALNTFPYT